MRRISVLGFICLLLIMTMIASAQAQTPVPTPFPTLPVAPATPALPTEITVALGALAVVVLGGAGAYIAGWFTRQTNKANAQVILDAKAAELKSELETKTKEVASDIDQQNLKERETIRSMVDFYVDRVKVLTSEIDTLRAAFRLDVDGFRNEIITLRSESTQCKTEIRQNKDEITGLKTKIVELKAEIESGRAREEKLREDVDHMPQEIARLKTLIEKQGNGDGQGSSKTVLSVDARALVKDAGDEDEKDTPT